MNTNTTKPGEARLEDARTVRNVLVAPPELHEDETVRDFFGTVVTPEELASGELVSGDLASEGLASGAVDPAGKSVYLCGDLSRVDVRGLRAAARVFVVRELSQGYGDGEGAQSARGRGPWSVPAGCRSGCTVWASTTAVSSSRTRTMSGGSAPSTSSSH
ncbi:hypothetical protein AB6O49_16555 [Streptomyces sp. SBR177]